MKSMPLIERKVVAGNNICGGVCLYDTARETAKFLYIEDIVWVIL
jgi:hypothetical protein